MPRYIALLVLFAGSGLCARHGGREGYRDVVLRAGVNVERLEVRDLGVARLDLAFSVDRLKGERLLAREDTEQTESSGRSAEK